MVLPRGAIHCSSIARSWLTTAQQPCSQDSLWSCVDWAAAGTEAPSSTASESRVGVVFIVFSRVAVVLTSLRGGWRSLPPRTGGGKDEKGALRRLFRASSRSAP